MTKTIEIEAKVRLTPSKKEAVLKKAKEIATFQGEKFKEDTYFSRDGEESFFRTRNQNGKLIVTKKKKSMKDGIEANEETEFEVSDFEAFLDFVHSLGFEVLRKKTKKTLAFSYGDFLLEFCEVPPLGYFLEIEILCSKNEVEEKKEKLLEVFAQFGFSEKDFERKKYLELLG